jgi:putative cardiolipin synthase
MKYFGPQSASLLAVILACLAAGCSTIDLKHPREPSTALKAPETTPLGQISARIGNQHQGQSGFRLLNNGVEAFVARAALIEQARETLDVQYYIIHGDETGKLLIGRLLSAADRGVRVRILVDDIYRVGNDANIAALDAHPNLEIRLFNPWKYRSGGIMKVFEFFTDAGRLNHRMHNKLFVADNAIMVMGGRNLGDEYFGLHNEMDYLDLDVLVAGPLTQEASSHFDSYWNSEWAVPLAARRDLQPTLEQLEAIRTQLAAHVDSMRSARFGEAALNSELARQIRDHQLQLTYAPAKVISDDPGKVVSNRKKDRDSFLLAQLLSSGPKATRELLVASPYFVPGKAGVRRFESLATNGVIVRILTNAGEAGDVPVVHAGYGPYRPDMLRVGVHLYEVKRLSDPSKEMYKSRRFGSANASLHAKCLVVDRERLFIGSLNLDPRSIERNTETGLVIESPELGRDLGALLDRAMAPDLSYEVVLRNGVHSSSKALEWRTAEGGKNVSFEKEPGLNWFKRFKFRCLGLLPLESQI